ncbi:hypothetical protein QJS10_CPB18g01358 [Acorus calamus]|uniref:Uncharacterized protein n=1 Tax=Acorus calamus TaxID=4465 RepID=A0AAV9CP22_ACOCL|nr:hypothetical protein QJS10_CPB18g01358 [Acorus calamus]
MAKKSIHLPSSSYFSPLDDDFLSKLNYPTKTSTPPSQPTSGFRRRNTYDGELDIFGAEKYFSGGLDREPKPPPSLTPLQEHPPKKEPKPNPRWLKLKPSGTPSASSQASWTSRSALLGAHARPQKQGTTGRSFLGGVFGCRCSCSDGKSVDVDGGAIPEVPTSSKTTNAAVVGGGEEKARVSLEVFRSPFSEAEMLGSSPQRRLMLLALNSGRMNNGAKDDDDDVCSESSSDLFEIESISVSRTRELYEDARSTTSCSYAPSEASVAWSVTTTGDAGARTKAEMGEVGASGRRQSRVSFMSCASERAVSVVAAGAHHRMGSVAAATVGRFNGPRVLSRSYSARVLQPAGHAQRGVCAACERHLCSDWRNTGFT